MNKVVITLIAAISFIALGLVALMLCLINNNGGNIVIGKNMELIDTQTISMENVNSLNIKYYSDDVIFYASDSNELIIKEYKNYTPKENQATKISTDNNKVTIEGYRYNGITNGISINRNSRVEVYLPLEFAGELSASTSSGDLSSDIAFRVTKFNATCSSGDIELNEITADNIKLFASSGDINLQKAAGQMRVSATSGDVTIAGISGAGEVSTSSGDARLSISELTGDIKLVVSSGDVTLKMPDTTSCNFEANASSGDIQTFFDDKLNYNDRKSHTTGKLGDNAQFNINIKASSGDINVERN